MRCVTPAAVLCLVVFAPALAAFTNDLPPEKRGVPAAVPAFPSREGGEDIASAIAIPTVPYVDGGNTCGHLNDYDEVCPYVGSTSPDVVYSYEPPYDVCVSVNLCDSFYDTKVYVYEDEWTPGEPLACNDDSESCVDPPVAYTSWLESVPLSAGHVYYIVVDGYGGGCGDYVLEIDEVDCPAPCVVECPPDGLDEGEGPCYDGYIDNLNGGCGSNPIAFSELAPSGETIVVCGLSGNYNDNTFRDTDWYLLDLTCDETTLTVCVEAEFSVIVGIVDYGLGCENITGYHEYAMNTECEEACFTTTVPPSEWAVIVSPSEFAGFPCDSDYVMTIDGYDACVPVERASWSAIKGMYR